MLPIVIRARSVEERVQSSKGKSGNVEVHHSVGQWDGWNQEEIKVYSPYKP